MLLWTVMNDMDEDVDMVIADDDEIKHKIKFPNEFLNRLKVEEF